MNYENDSYIQVKFTNEMQSLPRELLTEICLILDDKSLCKISQTCKLFKHITASELLERKQYHDKVIQHRMHEGYLAWIVLNETPKTKYPFKYMKLASPLLDNFEEMGDDVIKAYLYFPEFRFIGRPENVRMYLLGTLTLTLKQYQIALSRSEPLAALIKKRDTLFKSSELIRRLKWA